MERAVALSAAAEHATALRTIAETALPVPPPFGDMKVVDVVAAVWILKENFWNPECAVYMSPLVVGRAFHGASRSSTQDAFTIVFARLACIAEPVSLWNVVY